MSENRHSASAVIFNGLIYVYGGVRQSQSRSQRRQNPSNFVEAYDPKSNEWVVKITLYAYGAASIDPPPLLAFDGFLYVLSGERGVIEYDSDMKTSTQVK